jgi:hypothetical protein
MRAGDFDLITSGDDKLGQFRIIQAEQRFRSALRWLSDFESATWPEVYVFLNSYCPPGAMFEAILANVRLWKTKGTKPCEATSDGRALEDELRVAMSEFRKGFDTLSLIGSVISPLDEGDTFPYRILHDSVWLEPFAGSGGFLTITGPPRRGKTGIACLVMETFLRSDPDSIVLSNVIMESEAERVIEVPGVKALKREVIKAVKEHRKWLWVFDDAGLEWLKQRPMASSAISLERFARIVPKHRGSFVYIDQREGGIPTTISEFSDSRVRCLRPSLVFVRLPSFTGTIREVPLPESIEYVSEARSAFVMDGDIEDLIHSIPRPDELETAAGIYGR